MPKTKLLRGGVLKGRSKWRRVALSGLLAVVCAGLWGFVAVELGASILTIALGAAVIACALFGWIVGRRGRP